MDTENGPKGEVIFDPENQEKLEQFRKAFTIVLNDAPKEKVDAVFLHTMSYGDDDELFPLAAKLIKEGGADYIITNGGNGEAVDDPTPGAAWAGKDVYIRRLIEQGVDPKKIILSEPALHAYEANLKYLKAAEELGLKSAVTVNQPQQLVRATLGQLKAMEKLNYWMRVYSLFPEPWEAQREVKGNQGKETKRRFKMIGSDFDRISTYQAKGDLAAYEEFFDYISKRDSIR